MEEATAIDKIRNAVEIATKKLIIVNDDGKIVISRLSPKNIILMEGYSFHLFPAFII